MSRIKLHHRLVTDAIRSNVLAIRHVMVGRSVLPSKPYTPVNFQPLPDGRIKLWVMVSGKYESVEVARRRYHQRIKLNAKEKK